tara:strand:- start:1272 stop:1721 length:450 start_codon:yes stop_codon:yes gene_type:complete
MKPINNLEAYMDLCMLMSRICGQLYEDHPIPMGHEWSGYSSEGALIFPRKNFIKEKESKWFGNEQGSDERSFIYGTELIVNYFTGCKERTFAITKLCQDAKIYVFFLPDMFDITTKEHQAIMTVVGYMQLRSENEEVGEKYYNWATFDL